MLLTLRWMTKHETKDKVIWLCLFTIKELPKIEQLKISQCGAIICKSQKGILSDEKIDTYTLAKLANFQSKLGKWINLNIIST